MAQKQWLWLNEKHIDEGLDHKNLVSLQENILKLYRKNRYEIVDEPKKQPNIIFVKGKLAIKVIMNCRITTTNNFRALGLEQSVLRNIMTSFERENMQTQHSISGYMIFILS